MLLGFVAFALVLAAGVVARAQNPPDPPTATLAAKWTATQYPGFDAIEAEILRLTNTQRTDVGLPKLSMNPQMRIAARQHSREMGDLNYFSHESPVDEWKEPWQRTYMAGYWGYRIAENIASVTASDLLKSTCDEEDLRTPEGIAAHFLDLWMHSEGHRKNILDEKSTVIGVGVFQEGESIYATQDFGNPQTVIQQATLTPATGELVTVAIDGVLKQGNEVNLFVNDNWQGTVPLATGKFHAEYACLRKSGCYDIALAAGEIAAWKATLDTNTDPAPTVSSFEGNTVLMRAKVAAVTITPYIGLRLAVKATVAAGRGAVTVLQDDLPQKTPTLDHQGNFSFTQVLPKRDKFYVIEVSVGEQMEQLLFIDTNKPLEEAFLNRPS